MQTSIELIPEKTHSHIGGTVMHVLVRVHAPKAVHNPTRVPLNLALVLDRSGSMSGAKLEYAKAAAKYVMEGLQPEDRVSLVTFDDQVEIALPNSSAHTVKISKVLDAIDDRGSTNLHGGWLEVWSAPGEGSCFRLTLPRVRGDVLSSSPLELPPNDQPLDEQGEL